METTGFGGSAPEQSGSEPSAPATSVTAFAPSPLDPDWRPASDSGSVFAPVPAAVDRRFAEVTATPPPAVEAQEPAGRGSGARG